MTIDFLVLLVAAIATGVVLFTWILGYVFQHGKIQALKKFARRVGGRD